MVLDGSKKLGASDLTKLKGKFSASVAWQVYIFNKPVKDSDANK